VTGEIISIGDEVLAGDIVDTHASTAARVLLECGIDCRRRQAVPDDRSAIAEGILLAMTRARAIILIGGLGPTEDDLTRDGLADALGLEMHRDQRYVSALKRMVERRGFPWVESLARQADVPEGAEPMKNPNGTAPGLWLVRDGRAFAALPGPPPEFEPMLKDEAAPRLRAFSGDQTAWEIIHTVGIPESLLEQRLQAMSLPAGVRFAPYAKQGGVQLRISGGDQNRVQEAVSLLLAELGEDAFGVGGQTLAGAVLDLARSSGRTLACAESCTGGEVAAMLSAPAGASQAFRGGLVAYDVRIKQDQLAVQASTVAAHTVYSFEVAREMAEGARSAFGADFAAATTGVAGPGPDQEAPAGHVWISAAGPGGYSDRKFVLEGRQRADVRHRASVAALDLLRRTILDSMR
jgi:nicotinamide-nucleotide amidase